MVELVRDIALSQVVSNCWMDKCVNFSYRASYLSLEQEAANSVRRET
jgi:hypothetical protein